MFYPIERTSAIVDCCDPHTIGNRITGCLQKLSITAKFNASKESLFAETLDYTKFYIRLYKNNSINNKGILVELQRVDGDSFNFIKYVQAILASARGEGNGRKATVRRSSLNYIPSSIISSCQLDKRRQPEESNAEYMMHIEDLLKKDRSDAVLLGIESLLLLTDKDRSQVSLPASEVVLNGEHSIIKDFVRKCIHRPRLTQSPEDNTFDHASWQGDRLHNTALAVLGNSLQTASDAESSKLLDFLLESEEWMGHSGIVDALLSELSHAEDRSHDAYQASRCLVTLLGSSSEMKMALVERGLPSAMKVSQTVGQRKHSLLARECDAALVLMADE